MGHIFISYSRSDQRYARKLADKLLADGFDVWIDDRVDYGEDWWRSIIQAIRDCDAFIVIMTPDSDKSRWVQREASIADELQKPVFPLLLRGKTNLLDSQHWALYMRTQYADVRSGSFPQADFIDRLSKVTARRPDSGTEIASLALRPENSFKDTDNSPIKPQKREWLLAAGFDRGCYLRFAVLLAIPLLLVVMSVFSLNQERQAEATATAQAAIDLTAQTGLDSDGDGLSDALEQQLGIDPFNPDTDGDGLLDGEEVHVYGTDPLNPDTDGDTLLDGVEIETGCLSPLNPHTFSDGSPDNVRYTSGDPCTSSTPTVQAANLTATADPNTGITTVILPQVEMPPGESQFVAVEITCMADSCTGFNISLTFDPAVIQVDELEVGPYLGSNALVVDNWIDSETGALWLAAATLDEPLDIEKSILFSIHMTALTLGTSRLTVAQIAVGDHDGNPIEVEVVDGEVVVKEFGLLADPDNDGLTTAQELALGTDPFNPDTDGDGLLDGEEVLVYGTNPLYRDTDGDTLLDGVEIETGCLSPLNPNTFGSGGPPDNVRYAAGDPCVRPTPTQTLQPSELAICSDSPPARLRVGDRGQVELGERPVRLRAAPSTGADSLEPPLQPGARFLVLDGPTCNSAEGGPLIRFWRVTTGGRTGWAAEGWLDDPQDDNKYYLEVVEAS